MRIPIAHVKKFAREHDLSHVIVFAYDGKDQHVATYGTTIEACSQTADFGNNLKKILGWPDSLRAYPSKVKKLQAKVKKLQAELKRLKADGTFAPRGEDKKGRTS